MSHATSSWTLVPDPSRPTSPTGSGIAVGVDIALDAEGDIDLSTGAPRLTVELEAVAQGVANRVRMVMGEWFLNLEAGIPYFENDVVARADALLGGKFSELKVRAAFRKAILAAPGVLSIESLSVSFASGVRTLRVEFRVATVAGTIAATEEI